MTNKIKNPSPLVQSVLDLDHYLSEIIRLGEKIEGMELKSEFDFEQAQRLTSHFAECGQGVSDKVLELASHLAEARAKAEEASQRVSAQAEVLRSRQIENQQKMESFRALGEKVRDLTLSLQDLKMVDGENPSPEEQARVSERLSHLDLQLEPLIEEARTLRKEAQASRMKVLEQGADSLVQSLSAIGHRLKAFQPANSQPRH